MALLKQITSLTQGIASSLSITPKSFLPSALNNVASFATKKELVIPKRPLSPFFLFKEEKIDTVKRQLPIATHKQQLKAVGNMWAVLSEEQKEMYKNRYKTALEDYNQKIEAIENDPKLGPQLIQIKEDRKEKMVNKAYKKAKIERKNLMKDLEKPKRSITCAYHAFSQEIFPSLHKKEISATVTFKLIAEKWAAMTDAQKEPYVARFLKAKEVDDAALLAWKENLKEDHDDAVKEANMKFYKKKNKRLELRSRSNEEEK